MELTNQTRDFIYIDDLIRAIRFAESTTGIGGQVFQIATNFEASIKEMKDRLVKVLSDYGYIKCKSKLYRSRDRRCPQEQNYP